MRVVKSERRKIDEPARCQNDCSGEMRRPLRRMQVTWPTMSETLTGASHVPN